MFVLVNKGMGTPFISGLDLRPLKTTLYPEVNSSQSLLLINSNRFNLGPTVNSIIRYTLDPHDCLWSTYDTIPNWNEISAPSVIQNYLTDVYDVPSAVMQNAATVSGSRIDFSWDPSENISSSYFFIFYFAELQNVPSNAIRLTSLSITRHGTHNLTAHHSYSPILFLPLYRGWQVIVSHLLLQKNSTLPPILNAMEVYLVKPITEIATDSGDGKGDCISYEQCSNNLQEQNGVF